MHWRQLVGVAYTEEEAKALAAEQEVRNGGQTSFPGIINSLRYSTASLLEYTGQNAVPNSYMITQGFEQL